MDVATTQRGKINNSLKEFTDAPQPKRRRGFSATTQTFDLCFIVFPALKKREREMFVFSPEASTYKYKNEKENRRVVL